MKWLVIQTNLAQCPLEPMLDIVEVRDIEELQEKLDELERNDMSITAIPLTKRCIKLGLAWGKTEATFLERIIENSS